MAIWKALSIVFWLWDAALRKKLTVDELTLDQEQIKALRVVKDWANLVLQVSSR